VGLIAMMKTLRSNALECWTRAHFEEPVVLGGFPLAPVVVVSDPAAVRQILIEDQTTYNKSTLERRVLSARLRNGLVAVDGDQWQRLRRTLAPMFARKTIEGFAPEIGEAANSLIARWERMPGGSAIEVKEEMLQFAMDLLLRWIFVEGIGNPEAVRAATTRFYWTCGTLDPFDIIGLPDFVPRFTRLRGRPIMRAFEDGLNKAIAERRRRLHAISCAPRDMLGAMLAARDPETGEAMTDAEVKDDIMTFIFGGQETTSSALTWAIYLISQSSEWRERVLAEANRFAGANWHEAVEGLVETRAAVQEALRVYPPIIAITRTAAGASPLLGQRYQMSRRSCPHRLLKLRQEVMGISSLHEPNSLLRPYLLRHPGRTFNLLLGIFRRSTQRSHRMWRCSPTPETVTQLPPDGQLAAVASCLRLKAAEERTVHWS
jgi:cytochrome P450